MPSSVRVRILAARNLPIMDRASDLTDAFAEVKLGGTTYKTDVCRKNLNPVWNGECFDFDIDDEELQDEPLQIRVMDYDTISAHDAIGRVYIDLTPLVLDDGPKGISGWYPIFDTMHGIRGELNVQIRVKFIQDVNKFRQSSCGVRFFSSLNPPEIYHYCSLFGFVEELVVNDDPEYQWIDKIRKARASNEARQVLFSRLSGALQRRIGLKVLEGKGNAVLGQCFDLEGESGIVVRGIGTIAFVAYTMPSPGLGERQSPFSSASASHELLPVDQRIPLTASLTSGSSPIKFSLPLQRSSLRGGGGGGGGGGRNRTKSITSNDSIESTSPPHKDGSGVAPTTGSKSALRTQLYSKYALPSEFPFFTLCAFPPGLLINLGGLVSAHSVKLLDRINNPDEPETRDAWWTEIRSEIRSHARAMGCNSVVGYSEWTSICDELCVLSALGTAANLYLPGLPLPSSTVPPTSSAIEVKESSSDAIKDPIASQIDDFTLNNPFEIPYSPTSLPFPITLKKSPLNKKKYVPEVLLSTTEVPPNAQVMGYGGFIQARICRNKKKDKGESNAVAVSDALPFLQHDVHRQLLNKLKVKGMNAVFGLRIQVTVGESLLVAIASGTALYLAALPKPSLLTMGKKDVREQIIELTERNRALYNLTSSSTGTTSAATSVTAVISQSESDSDSDVNAEETWDHRPELDLSGTSSKPALIAEVGDQGEADAVSILSDVSLPNDLFCCSTQLVPGMDVRYGTKTSQMITVVQKKTILHPQEFADEQFSKIFNEILQLVSFKLSKSFPCCLCNLRFDCDLPDEDEVQLCVTGVVLSASKLTPAKRKGEDLQFTLEEIGDQAIRNKEGLPLRHLHKPPPTPPLVQVTSMPFISGAKTIRYLGNTNHFLIRESTSIRENGGLSAFMQQFLTDAQAIARAHVAAMGGNGLVTYRINECVLLENPMKNQGQCLLNISGDAVEVDYDDGRKMSFSEPETVHHKGLETAL